MSGKFMSVKRIVIPTITMIIIASQLLGCAAATQSEMLQMINQGDAIEIEIAVPLNQEEGTEISIAWTQLDQLTSQPNLRKSMDGIFKIVPFGENSKNGVFYVNLAGEQDGNNTLYNVFANAKFRDDYWNKVSIQSVVAAAAARNYADVEYEEGYYESAVLAAINGYFNILNDSESGYANMDSTLTRLEAMAAIFKAENPVTDTLSEDIEFNKAVDSSNTNEYTVFASNLSEQSYLDISSGSLDNMTANGTITRGELAYMLVQQYFKADYDKADPKATCYSDAVNGGNIAQEQKFIEDATSKPHWQSYELSYAINNPDKGCPERMYKALVVAFDKGIITDSECRWDEGVTKADLLEILTNAYLAMPAQFSASQGKGEEVVVVEETPTETEVINEGTEGDPTQQDIQIPESKPTPESITPQSEVEDMIAAYPDEITPELQAELDDIKDWYEQGLLPIEAYKEDTYNTLYGPSAEELDRQLQEIINDAVKDNYIPAPEGALDGLETTGQGAPEKIWDPNYVGSDNLKGYRTY